MVASYDPGDGTDVSRARSFGWTADDKFVINFDGDQANSGGYEVNVLNGSRMRYSSVPGYCSADGRRWPMRGNGHGAKSPDGNWKVRYYGSEKGLTDLQTCDYSVMGEPLYPKTISHFSWNYSNDWWIVDDRGEGGDFPNQPTIEGFGVYQMWKDGTVKLLFESRSAEFWYDQADGGTRVDNWHARPLPTLRKDGRQVLYTSTGGKFSFTDHKKTGITDWGTEGFYLADINIGAGGASGTGDTQVKTSNNQMNK